MVVAKRQGEKPLKIEQRKVPVKTEQRKVQGLE